MDYGINQVVKLHKVLRRKMCKLYKNPNFCSPALAGEQTKSEGLRPHDFTCGNIVAVAIFVQPLGGLVGQTSVFLDKGSDVPTGCRGVQTTDAEDIVLDCGDNRLIGLQSDAPIDGDDFAVCVGVVGKSFLHDFISLHSRGAPSLMIQV